MNAHNNMKKSFKVHKGGDDSNLGGGGVLCQDGACTNKIDMEPD